MGYSSLVSSSTTKSGTYLIISETVFRTQLFPKLMLMDHFALFLELSFHYLGLLSRPPYLYLVHFFLGLLGLVTSAVFLLGWLTWSTAEKASLLELNSSLTRSVLVTSTLLLTSIICLPSHPSFSLLSHLSRFFGTSGSDIVTSVSFWLWHFCSASVPTPTIWTELLQLLGSSAHLLLMFSSSVDSWLLLLVDLVCSNPPLLVLPALSHSPYWRSTCWPSCFTEQCFSSCLILPHT